jgi:hypothetical protein
LRDLEAGFNLVEAICRFRLPGNPVRKLLTPIQTVHKGSRAMMTTVKCTTKTGKPARASGSVRA